MSSSIDSSRTISYQAKVLWKRKLVNRSPCTPRLTVIMVWAFVIQPVISRSSYNVKLNDIMAPAGLDTLDDLTRERMRSAFDVCSLGCSRCVDIVWIPWWYNKYCCSRTWAAIAFCGVPYEHCAYSRYGILASGTKQAIQWWPHRKDVVICIYRISLRVEVVRLLSGPRATSLQDVVAKYIFRNTL